MTSRLEVDRTQGATSQDLSIVSLFSEREPERYVLHSRHLNEMMVRVLKSIGYDVGFCGGTGQYLFDRAGVRYLDLLSGWGVFGIGRNHPKLRDVLTSVLAADFPNLVQMDVSPLAGILAEKLLQYTPYLDKVLFANSGAEAVEASIKLARKATGRSGLVYCTHAFHGLSYGALSLNGDNNFRDGFGPLLSHCSQVPFNDLAALDEALATRQVAAFIVEPVQGKGVNLPDDGYLPGAQELCRQIWDFAHSRRNSDRSWPNWALPGDRTLGHRARYCAAVKDIVRRARSGCRCAGPQMDIRQSVRSHGSGSCPRLDVCRQRSRHGCGTGDT